MKIWGFAFAFAFVLERQINFLRFSFAFAFVTIMLGKHKPHQQATLTKKNQIPDIFFRFCFLIQKRENPRSWDFYFFSLVTVPLGIRPPQKIFSPPPPKFPADTLLAPRPLPLLEEPPPPLGIFNKTRPPPSSWRSPSPCPPRRKNLQRPPTKYRGRELNTNIFFSNFSGALGISWQNPGISRQKVWFP